jgi:hypothetical protein
MKLRYRITPQGRPPEPSDAEIARYRDPQRVVLAHVRARDRWHRKPLYKDPRSFLALLLILLLAWLLSEGIDRKKEHVPAPQETGAQRDR